MDPHTNLLVAIIVVVTLGLFLAGLLRRLYHGDGYEARRSGADFDRE